MKGLLDFMKEFDANIAKLRYIKKSNLYIFVKHLLLIQMVMIDRTETRRKKEERKVLAAKM